MTPGSALEVFAQALAVATAGLALLAKWRVSPLWVVAFSVASGALASAWSPA